MVVRTEEKAWAHEKSAFRESGSGFAEIKMKGITEIQIFFQRMSGRWSVQHDGLRPTGSHFLGNGGRVVMRF